MMNHRLRRFQSQITQIILLVTSYWLSRMKFPLVKRFGIPMSFLVVTLLSGLVTASYADTVSSIELINNAGQYDGQSVVYEGEVIGDIMARGEYCWVNINDGIGAIGIWLDKDLTKNIIYTGGYRAKGDEVRVAGVFHRACLEHGGDLDIHANSLRKMTTGGNFQEKVNIAKRNFVIVLLVILCLVWILTLLKRK